MRHLIVSLQSTPPKVPHVESEKKPIANNIEGEVLLFGEMAPVSIPPGTATTLWAALDPNLSRKDTFFPPFEAHDEKFAA